MAIDPDMQPILDALDAKIADLEGRVGVGGDNGLLAAERRFSAVFSSMLNSKTVAEQVVALDALSTFIATLK